MREWFAENGAAVVENGIYTAAFGGLAVGCGLAWLPLGLIVPSCLILIIGILSRMRR